MKICIICVNKTDYVPKRIFEEGKKMGHAMHLMTWLDIVVSINEKEIFLGDRHKSLSEFDAIIPRSPNYSAKRRGKKIVKRLSTLLKLIIEFSRNKNIFVLNEKYFTTYASIDKLAQQFFIFSNGLPGIPSKYFSALDRLRKKDTLEYPLVVKTAQGSLGTGVFRVTSQKSISVFLEESNATGKFFLFQKYLKIGCDYRVLVIDKKAIGVIKRTTSSKNEWRTNVSLGGNARKVEKKEGFAIEKLAEKVASKMSFDYVGVDILKHNGRLHIIEVNSLAQFRGFEKAFPEINVGKKVIELAEKKVNAIRGRKPGKMTNQTHSPT
jgi:RimK family alpha-L-glutamate ligase